MRFLILGGTTEASALCRAVAGREGFEAVLSLAGRTKNPAPPPISCRVGGFGGIPGLIDYLRDERIDAVIDATHPFAAIMSANASAACKALAVPLAVFTRRPWQPVMGDQWIEVQTIEQAVSSLRQAPCRVFLTVGSLQLSAFAAVPQHYYLIRTIDPPSLDIFPSHRLILARGPFTVEEEIALIQDERIDLLVTKNSGGEATAAKLAAARQAKIPVIMLQRPPAGDAEVIWSVEEALQWLGRHRQTAR